ncbi:MAG TPA: phosphatase PAP2 family protein [Cyclobacteriaceae bacterium]|nr:phosphatase PAP2 family protein [Cyclobacteriaceae bacterium]
MEKLLELDRRIFIELNSSFRNPFVDQLMMFLSTTYAWIPLHLFLLYLLVRNYRKQTWLILLAIGLTILLADQITSSIMKPFFERLRPSHEPSLAEQVFLVNKYRGGRFGFASSHAANTFGIATLMWLVLRMYRPWISLLFAWALLVGYTRIYLGVHYPGDILVGFLIGWICALAAYYLLIYVRTFLEKNKKLRPRAD